MGLTQNVILPKPVQRDAKSTIFQNEVRYQAIIHPNGFDLGYSKGVIRTFYKTYFYHFTGGVQSHPKENYSALQFFRPTSSRNFSSNFILGKINYFVQLRAGRGVQHYISDKANIKSVKVGYSYGYGLNIGLLKPYLLEVKRLTDGNTQQLYEVISYNEETHDRYLDADNIVGSTRLLNGWEKTKITPGAHGFAAVNFTWGQRKRNQYILETGLRADGYMRKIPLMINQSKKPLFFNLYLSLQYGRKK